ncbi:hypothetical protein D6774_01000 [Candidatus Woesearchaeota archaeon]|nr:MAG: hypothetical protein D6774_01000 [Candidatus Woesearchaeota archaeon]
MSKEYTFSEEFKQLCDDLAQGIALLNDIPCENAVSSLLAPFPVRRTVTLFFEDCASIFLAPTVVEGIERIVEEGICDDDSARSFVALCEEISHVLLYASRLDVGRTTSHGELETQANIDVYFMLSSFLMQQNNQDHKWNGLHEYVVGQVFRDQYV